MWSFILSALKYSVCGVSCSVLNALSYVFFTRVCSIFNVLATVLAWFISNLASFLGNKFFVFAEKDKSKEEEKNVLHFLGSMIFFMFTRLAGGFGEAGFMALFANKLGWNDMLVKILSISFWGIFNFLLGKYLIFSNKSKN